MMKLGTLLAMFLFVAAQLSAQEITTASSSCRLDLAFCNGDTAQLTATNQADFTNFKWYYGSVAMANEITAPNLANGVVFISPSRDSLVVVGPGGMYIMTGEYVTPTGCSAINDTIVVEFQPVPLLSTLPDTICSAAGESVDLAARVTDANNVAGTTSWFATLADALANTASFGSTVVAPAATTTYYVRKTSGSSAGCFDIDSVQVVASCLSLGNQVWYDTDNSGTKNGTEAGIENVTVQLFLDADGNGILEDRTGTGGPNEQVPVGADVTDAGGLYLFENLKEGKYFVGIPSGELGSGGDLRNLYSSGTVRDNMGGISETTANSAESDPSDLDDNGTTATAGFYSGGVLSDRVMLMYFTEPTGEAPDNSTAVADNNDNQAVDFGFYGMSLGSLVFMDTNNNGTFDSGTEMAIAGVTVKLYSQDGTALLATATTGPDGRYLFTNLPEGSYIAAVLLTSAPLVGKMSADDIASSTSANSADADDNGTTVIGNEVWSNIFTLDAGMAPTGEPDQGQASSAGMGNPATSDNPNTPDENSNLHVDFGFKSDCPAIGAPSADQVICADQSGGTNGSDITVPTSLTAASSVRFVRFATAQAGTAMYTGGTDLETVTPATGTATYTFDIADFPNTGTAAVTYFVYAVMEPASADPTCRPFQEIEVTVNPRPAASPATLTLCETTTSGGSANFTLSDADATVLGGQTGMTLTYHDTQADADNDASPITMKSAANGASVYARVETANGCFRTSTVTLNVNQAPNFDLSLPVTCPGGNPTVKINNLSGADPFTAEYMVNAGAFAPYSALTNTTLTIAEGIMLGATNTVTLRNALVPACSTSKTVAVPNVTSKVCMPVKVVVKKGL